MNDEPAPSPDAPTDDEERPDKVRILKRNGPTVGELLDAARAPEGLKEAQKALLTGLKDAIMPLPAFPLADLKMPTLNRDYLRNITFDSPSVLQRQTIQAIESLDSTVEQLIDIQARQQETITLMYRDAKSKEWREWFLFVFAIVATIAALTGIVQVF